MSEEQTPVGAPAQAGTTPPVVSPVGASVPTTPKRKRGRPRKIRPEPVPLPAAVDLSVGSNQPAESMTTPPPVPFPTDTISPARAEFSKELASIRTRLDALEAYNAKMPPPVDTRTNLERAEERSKLRLEAQKALKK